MDFYTMFAPIQPNWRHEEPGKFDYEATGQEDGSVEVYIQWGDGMPGDELVFNNDNEAREYLAFLLEMPKMREQVLRGPI